MRISAPLRIRCHAAKFKFTAKKFVLQVCTQIYIYKYKYTNLSNKLIYQYFDTTTLNRLQSKAARQLGSKPTWIAMACCTAAST